MSERFGVVQLGEGDYPVYFKFHTRAWKAVTGPYAGKGRKVTVSHVFNLLSLTTDGIKLTDP